MRILITTGIFEPESGGPAMYTPQLATALSNMGHVVTVMTYSDAPRLETDEKYNFKLIRIVRGNKLFNRFRFFKAAFKELNDCDLVYTLDWFAAGVPVSLAARLQAVPYIVRVGGDYAWEQMYLESGAKPVSLTDFYQEQRFSHLGYKMVLISIRNVLQKACHVVFNTDGQRMLYAHYYDLKSERISTIYNAVPHMDTVPLRDAPNKEIIYWGRLIVMKNVESLIRAFAQSTLPFEYTLTIIGDGPQKLALQKLILDLSLQTRVQLLPAMPKDEVLQRVRNARAFVLPSWTDISPSQVYEALAMKLPTLVTQDNFLPIRDQLPNMINPHSIEDIAAKLALLGDDAKYEAFARAFCAITFDQSWERIAQQHDQLFASILHPQEQEEVVQTVSETPVVTQVRGIRVLQIGADRSKRGILYQDSAAAQRQVGYGAYVGALDIVGFSLDKDKRLPYRGSANVCVYPTNSTFRLMYGFDAMRIAWRLPRPDVISVQDPFETGLVALVLSILWKVPLHVQVHTDPVSYPYAHYSWVNQIRVWIAYVVLNRANRVRVVSDRIKKGLEGRWHINAPISVLPIFADIEKFKRAAPDSTISSRFLDYTYRVLVVSRLEPEKNVALAIHAFAKAAPPVACLIIVGDGSEHGHLVNLAHRLGLSNRVFFENERDSLPYYAIADVVLVPSLYEGYGLTILEARAAGKPVISTDVGAAHELGAIVTPPAFFAQTLMSWFNVPEDKGRPSSIDRYPYKSFDDYARMYTDDIKACVAVMQPVVPVAEAVVVPSPEVPVTAQEQK